MSDKPQEPSAVTFCGINPLNPTSGAVLPMIPDSWRYKFTQTNGGTLSFCRHDQGDFVAWAAVEPLLPKPSAGIWKLDFRPTSETPTEPGDYILYNPCDGYHIVETWFDGDKFDGFWFFAAATEVSKDFYSAWAKLPDTNKELRPIFASLSST